MAPPFLIMASREPLTREDAIQSLIGYEENKPPEREKQKGKKSGKSKSPAKKKPPQRGMGVAQLERLRLQERWKKLTETDPVHSLTPQTQFQPQISHSFSVPFGSSPAMIGNGGNGSGLNRLLMFQKLGSNGGHGFNGVGGSGSGGRGSVVDRVQVDSFKSNIGGVSDPRSGNGRNVFETPKELSSIQKMQLVPDPCDVCFKKKRPNAEISGLINGGRDKFAEASSMMNGSYFLGLNHGDNGIINGDQFRHFNAATTARHVGTHLDKEVEVMAVHRSASTVGGSIFMEYEFLPRNRSPFYCPNNEPVGVTTSNNDTSIDLSLKL